MKATHQTNKHPMYPVLNNKKTALSGAKSFFIALVAMMILSLTASAELITYSWLRMDLYKSPGTDRSGLGHDISGGFTGGGGEVPNNTKSDANNIAVGGPLGPEGYTSTVSVRTRGNTTSQASWFREPSPVSAQNYAGATKVNTNSWGNMFQTNKNWVVETWFLPSRNGAEGNIGLIFATGLNRNNRSVGLQQGVALLVENGPDLGINVAGGTDGTPANDGHVWVGLKAVATSDATNSAGVSLNKYIGPRVLVKTPTNAAWMHYAVVRDDSAGLNLGTVSWYTNGVLVASVPSSQVLFTNAFASPAWGGGQDEGYSPTAANYALGGRGLPGAQWTVQGHFAEMRFSIFEDNKFSTTNLLTRRAAVGSPVLWTGPTIISHPASTTVWQGGAASFNITAATDTSTTYQWQRAGVPIANATNRNYSLAAAAPGDNGALFTCVLNLNSQNVTSTVATLTVVAPSADIANGYSNAVMSEASLVAFFPVDGSTGTTLNNAKEPSRPGVIINGVGAFFEGNTNKASGTQTLALNSPVVEYTGGYLLNTNQFGYVDIAGDNPAFDMSTSGGNQTIQAVLYADPSIKHMADTGSRAETATWFSSSTIPNSFDYYNFSADVNGNIYYRNAASGGQRLWVVPGGIVGKRTHITMVIDNYTNVTCYANGASLGVRVITAVGNTPPSITQPLRIGLRGGDETLGDTQGYLRNAWHGSVDNLAIYSSALSAATIASQYNILINGSTPTGPSIVKISPSKNLYVGYPVQVLNVTAGGTPPLSYQWRNNGVPVANATNASYSVPTAAAGVYNYSVVITNAVAPFATTSAPVVLTVVAPSGYGATVFASSGGGPKAFYPLTETSGTTILDWAGTHDGEITGGYTLGGVGPVGGTGSIKMYGTNILNPSTQIDTFSAVTVPYYPELNPENNGNFTHEFWYKPDTNAISSCPVSSTYAIGGNKAGMSTIVGNGARGIAQTTINNWTIIYGKYNNINQGVIQGGTGGAIPPVVGEWQHIASVADGNNATVTCYVNGQADLVSSQSYTQHPLDTSVTGGVNQNYFAPLVLGNYTLGNFPMQGSLSQVAIYDYALTFNDITNHTSQVWTQAFFTLQPVTVTQVESLGTVTLTAKAIGVPNTYEWYKDGIPLVDFLNLDGSVHYPTISNAGGVSQGIAGPKLVISQPKTNDSGLYFLRVYNPLNAGGFTNSVAVAVNITSDTVAPHVIGGAVRAVTVSGPVMDDAMLTAGTSSSAPLSVIEVSFSKRMDPGSATNVANYTVSGGVIVTNVIQANSVADTKFGGDYRTVSLVTAGLTPGATYNVTIANVYDQATFSNNVPNTTVAVTAPTLQANSAVWNYYYRLGNGTFVSLVPGTNAAFPYVPQYTARLTNMSSDAINPGKNLGNVALFANQGDNYVSTITALVTPTNTGYYEFWVNGDDETRLYLNPFGSDPAGATWIGDRFSGTSEFSDIYAIPTHYLLNAGTPYFMQIVSVEGGGNDSSRAGWRYLGTVDQPYDGTGANGAWIVDATNVPAIQGNYLSAYTVAPITVPTPATVVAAAGATTNLVTTANGGGGLLSYQWLQNGVNAGSTARTNPFALVAFSNYSSNWAVRVTDGITTVTSAPAALVPPGGVAFTVNPTNKAVPFGLASAVGATATTTSGRINYRWKLSGVDVTGANYGNAAQQVATGAANLTIASMQSSNAGPYTVAVDDGWYLSTNTSTAGTLTVANNPAITNSVSGAVLSMSFPSQVGPSYVVETKSALTNAAWVAISTNVGTGATITVPSGTTNTQGYFRVRMR